MSAFVCSFLLLLPGTFASFNYEVEKRVNERLNDFLGALVASNLFVANFRENGGFPHEGRAQDRDFYLKLAYSLPHPLIYMGLESGYVAGYYETEVGNFSYGFYREPGESGYEPDEEAKQKHYKSCFNLTGEPQDCVMQPEAPYARCVNNCELVKCPDEDSQRNCSDLFLSEEEKVSCERNQKWCPNYTIENAPVNKTVGFVPSAFYCFDGNGSFTQEPGAVINGVGGNSSVDKSTCHYFQQASFPPVVDRNLVGDYAYCGNEGQVCNNTFDGAHLFLDFDPRLFEGYMATKKLQRPNWSRPHEVGNREIGFTHSQPLYSLIEGRKIFAGVVGITYSNHAIVDFLVSSYGNTQTSVVIFEDSEPHYVIGTSTGSDAAKKVYVTDETRTCEEKDLLECKAVRVEMTELTGNVIDTMLVRAFRAQKASMYPRDSLVPVKSSDKVDSDAYVSQVTLYEGAGPNLRWRILVASPAEKGTNDSVTMGEPLFVVLCVIGGLGVTICLVLFGTFFVNRKERAVVFADYRFTCAFILGCALMNGSTFTELGPNTNATCMLRMWSFHFCFVLVISPLFAKVWRIKKLVGGSRIRRRSISHARAACYTLPIILTQLVILTIFSIVDPSKQADFVEIENGSASQHIVCQHDTKAFFIVMLVFEGGLVLAGCILSYLIRNLDEKFDESKQLFFAMYNIAFIGIVTVLLISLLGVDPNAERLLQAIGVFWGTVFSSAVFVLPRLMQVQDDRRLRRESSGITVSGHSARDSRRQRPVAIPDDSGNQNTAEQ